MPLRKHYTIVCLLRQEIESKQSYEITGELIGINCTVYSINIEWLC